MHGLDDQDVVGRLAHQAVERGMKALRPLQDARFVNDESVVGPSPNAAVKHEHKVGEGLLWILTAGRVASDAEVGVQQFFKKLFIDRRPSGVLIARVEDDDGPLAGSDGERERKRRFALAPSTPNDGMAH